MRNAIVLAAGKGTRMKSEMNKVMHPVIDRPILAYILSALKKAKADRIVVVAGYQAESLMEAFPDVEFALQKEQLGTGHAVMQCSMLENATGQTLIINGDVPCIQPETLEQLYQEAEGSSLVLLSALLEDGAHYGRIVRDENGDFEKIVEAKDCTEEQKKICEINTGVYCFDNQDLFGALSLLDNDNAQHEYYLTDLVDILNSQNKETRAVPVKDVNETLGVNTVEELAGIYDWMKQKNNRKWMGRGVQIVDPSRTVIGDDVEIGTDVIIYPDTELLGRTVVGSYAKILPFSWLNNAIIGERAATHFCKIENAALEPGALAEMTVMKEGNSKNSL